MERQYTVRKPNDIEKEQYIYVYKDEKDIPLETFEPVEILEYRNYKIPIYCDDYGQAFFIRFQDDEWSNPNCYYDDFLDFIDSKLDYLVPTRNIDKVEKNLSDLSYKVLKLSRQCETGDTTYLKFKSLQKDVIKYLELLSLLLNKVVVKDNDIFTYGNVKYLLNMREDMIFSDIILDQIKRIQENKLKGE